jgi:hypothetical protein
LIRHKRDERDYCRITRWEVALNGVIGGVFKMTRLKRIVTGTRSSATAARSPCGWCKDKPRVSRRITPLALTQAVTDPDPASAKRAFDAMMQMKKIDIAAIEAARRG